MTWQSAAHIQAAGQHWFNLSQIRSFWLQAASLVPMIAGSTEVTEDIAEDLLRAADQYMLDGLKHLCEETISKQLNQDNLAETYDLAENFNAPQLGRRCALYALEHHVVSEPEPAELLLQYTLCLHDTVLRTASVSCPTSIFASCTALCRPGW